ncbi:MAG: sigma-70 family RNA polymerase sigma factor [Phycisphaerae bacterium]|nr:sigma-70 family RNA polymerase sigma factor [Phycisphaerae bacterium]
MSTSPSEMTRLIAAVAQGDRNASSALLPVVYQELRALAGKYLRGQRRDHTLQPTALVHEAYLKLIDQTQAKWNDRAHFFAVAATAMRQILVNHAVARAALKRGGGRAKIALDENVAAGDQPEFDPIALDEALKKLAEFDERKSKVVELRFFSGLTVDEVAEVLNISRSTVEGDWRMARAWLSRELAEGV